MPRIVSLLRVTLNQHSPAGHLQRVCIFRASWKSASRVYTDGLSPLAARAYFDAPMIATAYYCLSLCQQSALRPPDTIDYLPTENNAFHRRSFQEIPSSSKYL